MMVLNIENIINNNGYLLSIAGILIVFVTLIITSIFIAILPYILKILDRIKGSEHLPKQDEIALAIVITASQKGK